MTHQHPAKHAKYALLTMSGDKHTPAEVVKLAEMVGLPPETVTRWLAIPAGAQILTAEDVAGLLQVSEQMTYKLLRDGDLKGRKVGREWRTTLADVVDFMGKHQTTEPLTAEDLTE